MSWSVWSTQALRRVISQIQVIQDGRNLSVDIIESCVLTLELVYREFVTMSTISRLSEDEEVAARCVINALRILSVLRDNSDIVSPITPPVMPPQPGRVGRPRFVITSEQLQYLVENHFTVPQISQLLGVSSRTVERRLSDYGISIRATYANITDVELCRLIADIQREHPFCGNRQMRGHLLSRGFRVQQQRIREAQRAVDPEGSIMRRLSTVNRRAYKVAAPRSLWHIDSNHKLIR